MKELNEELIYYCKEGNIEETERLIKKGADVNASDAVYDYTALIWASVRGDIELAELLIDNGADVNAVNAGGTALRFAAYYFNTKIAKLLIKNGADVNAVDEVGHTCLIDACVTFESKSEMCRLLGEFK
tara:strand:+ start:3058 stop:3444 length:387 start_codon:yes stop_codon:yes gene_type:complete